MDNVWKDLPYDMVREILGHVDDIDVRIAFKIPPRKISEAKAWRLWYMLTSHDGLIYNIDTSTLHCFEAGQYSNRRPVSLRYITDWTCVFNDEEAPHDLEIVRPDGSCTIRPNRTEPIFTNLRVLLRGSQIK